MVWKMKMKNKRKFHLSRKTYKYLMPENISSLRTVSMIPGDRKVAGCLSNFLKGEGIC